MPTQIAVWGGKGTYSDEIARILFPKGKLIYTDDSENRFLEVMGLVKNGSAKLGVIPYWNDYARNNNMPLTYEQLADSMLFVNNIPRLFVELHLASHAESFEQIETIYMFKVVEPQCRDFILSNIPKARIVTDNISSTKAALDRANRESNAAAVGRKDAAEELGLSILSPQQGIQQPRNYTHFLVISSSLQVEDEQDNTLIIARLADKSSKEEEILNRLLNDCVTAHRPERSERITDGKRWYITQVDGRYFQDKWIQKSIDDLKKNKDVDRVRILGTCRWINANILTNEPKYVE